MSRPKILIYVQNLLGIGHLRRAAAISQAADRDGFCVSFVSGGMEVPDLNIGGATFHQLPPVRTEDDNFKTLLDSKGRPIDDNWRRNRRDNLLALFKNIKPQILVTELFPFGRRQLRFELIPLLESAKSANWNPKIVCSMRDILVTKPRADRNREIADTLLNFYDLVLVHGDERIITLAETFPLYQEISHLTEYTGYVLTPRSKISRTSVGAGEVIVSVGGGAVGKETISKVFELRKLVSMRDRRWRFVAGHHMASETFQKLSNQANSNIIVERTIPDLPEVIERADLSISQAGYNTVAELIAKGTPSVVIPFEGGVETEQRLRADLLARSGHLEVLPEDLLDEQTLDKAMQQAYRRGRRRNHLINLDGAKTTTNFLHKLLGPA